MKLKKMLAFAVGVGLCVGGEVWGVIYYSTYCFQEGGKWYFSVSKADGKEEGNIVVKPDPLKEAELEKIGSIEPNILQTIKLFYLPKATTYSIAVSEDKNFYGKTGTLTIPESNVDKLFQKAYANSDETVIQVIQKTLANYHPAGGEAEKKEPEKPEKEGSKKDIEKEGESGADESETKMVKVIAVAANPLGNNQYDFFFQFAADFSKDDHIFTALKGPWSNQIEKSALIEPGKTDNFYYVYFPDLEKKFLDFFTTKNMKYYVIKSENISTLEVENNKYTPIDFIKNYPNAHFDEKIIKWLKDGKNMNTIHGAIIARLEKKTGKTDKGKISTSTTSTTGSGKALEIAGQADLNNLANTLYKLALPAK